MSAYDELMTLLEEGEVVEAVVFGQWGWSGYNEPNPAPVPKEYIGKTLTLKEAEPFMEGWSFYGGYGSPDCYATNIWTNRRVFFIMQYDGSTNLDWLARNPPSPSEEYIPDMPGG